MNYTLPYKHSIVNKTKQHQSSVVFELTIHQTIKLMAEFDQRSNFALPAIKQFQIVLLHSESTFS